MKHLIKKVLPKIKRYAPIILITALAVFLRLYSLEHRSSFDADQEEIAFKAKEIITGNPVLLGPKTSLGGFSIGPGFTYLWAITSLILKGDPASGAYTSLVLGILFIVAIYFVGKNIFSNKVGIILAFITAVSSSLISWDQSPWAPSLFYLSELILFYGAYMSNKNKYGLVLIAIGFALGIQSHFAIFLLVLPVLIYLLIYKPILDRKVIFWSLVILLASMAPIIIYDVTHSFINLQRLFSIFHLSREGISPPGLKILSTLVSNSVNVLWPNFPLYARYILFAPIIIVAGIGTFKNTKLRSFTVLSLLMLIVPFVMFLFYKSNFSEYYLMTALPPFILILGYFFSMIHQKTVALIIFGIFLYLNLNSFIHFVKPMNVYAKKQIVKEIVNKGGLGDYGVSLSTEPGYSFGYPYIFDYYKANPNIPPLKGQKKIFTIISPPKYRGIESMYEVDGIGLRWEGIN